MSQSNKLQKHKHVHVHVLIKIRYRLPLILLYHWQGPSPDEVALVDGARQLGFELTARGNQDLTLKFLGADAKFQVLNVMEFSSERGRMSVIVRSPDGSIRLLVKGSDAKMLALLRPDTPKSHLEETNKNLHLFATQASQPPWPVRMWQHDSGRDSSCLCMVTRPRQQESASLNSEPAKELQAHLKTGW